MNPLNNIIFDWPKLANKEKKVILQVMKPEDIETIKKLTNMFNAQVLTVEVIDND